MSSKSKVRRWNERPDAGFTLTEVLAATMIFGLVAASLAAVLSQSTGIYLRSRQTVRQDQVLRSIHARIAQDFATVTTFTLSTPYLFNGEQQGFAMIAWGEDDSSPYVVVRYEWNPVGAPVGQGNLVRSTKAWSSGSDRSSGDWSDEITLFTGKDFAVQYFDGRRQVWTHNWRSGDTSYPPAAVRLVLTDHTARQTAMVFPAFAGRQFVSEMAVAR